jgi:hypothetical protein
MEKVQKKKTVILWEHKFCRLFLGVSVLIPSSDMQNFVKIIKFTFLILKLFFHITGALHVSTDMVIIRCLKKIDVEICCTYVIEYNSEVYTCLCAHM